MLKDATQQQDDDLTNPIVDDVPKRYEKAVAFSNIKAVDVAEIDLCTPGIYRALFRVMGLDGSTTIKGVIITVE
ncbi:hypothetical protein QQ060_003065 [Listeria monocytogenes]|nr:hypothetical protein [Listeria monocytogenes]